MGVGAGPLMYDVVVKKFTFAISPPDEFLVIMARVEKEHGIKSLLNRWSLGLLVKAQYPAFYHVGLTDFKHKPQRVCSSAGKQTVFRPAY